jgi:hypothetical protein
MLLVPACVIRVGTGTDDGATSSNTEQEEQPENEEQESPPTEAELADMLAQADPQQLMLNSAKAQYAAYYTLGLVSSQVGDPSTLGEETLMQLVEQYAPAAMDEAEKWIATIDPSTLDAPVVQPDFDCMNTHGCEGVVSCPFAKVCVITGCGTNGCGPCPDIFDLSKIAALRWCSYTCVVGKDTVGLAIVFVSKFKLLTHKRCFANGAAK